VPSFIHNNVTICDVSQIRESKEYVWDFGCTAKSTAVSCSGFHCPHPELQAVRRGQEESRRGDCSGYGA
jgi:hypothetical protein